MSYITQPAGLTSVATDGVTITGDGTTGDPLVAVGAGSVYSVAKTVFSNGALPPYVVPASVFYTTDATWFTPEIASADVSYAAGVINFVNAGTYKITMQMSFLKIPDPNHHDVSVQFGLTSVAPNPPLYEAWTEQHFDANDSGTFSVYFTTVIEATAGQTLQPTFVLGGSAAAQVNLVVGNQAGYIITERLA